MKVAFRFSKGEEARFLSHLDLMRTFERAFRRAELPMKYSEGFNPRPKLVFADAVPVGVTSRVETAYVDSEEPISPHEAAVNVNTALPAGLHVDEAWKVPAHARDTSATGRPRQFLLEFRISEPEAGETIRANAESLVGSESLVLSRSKGGKAREVDVRGGIRELSCDVLGEGTVKVLAVLASDSPAPKVRELAALLLKGVGDERPDWQAEKLA